MLVAMKAPPGVDGDDKPTEVVVDPQKICSVEPSSFKDCSLVTFAGGSTITLLGTPRAIADAVDQVMQMAARVAAQATQPIVVPPNLRAVD